MSAPSVLLKQHIGTIERQIELFTQQPLYIGLESSDCTFKDGVILTDELLHMVYTPQGVTWDLLSHEADTHAHIDRVLWVQQRYLELLCKAPFGFVKNAFELDQRRAEYARMVLRERAYVGNKLYWVNSKGIWLIRITDVRGGQVTFDVENSELVCGETYTRVLSAIKVFDTYDEAVAARGGEA